MSAKTKSKFLIRVDDLPLDLVVENEANPNEMSDREFDLLVHNMDAKGWTDPMYVVPVDLTWFDATWKALDGKKNQTQFWDAMRKDKQTFRLVGGHHRVKAGLYLQLDTGPAVIDTDPDFDKDAQEVQMVRHNVIHGKMSPEKFLDLYKRHEAKHGAEMMADMFGFADEEVMRALIEKTAKELPEGMKQAFKEAAAEVKTVDDLAALLNKLFSTFGNTLPYSFMFLDYGGKHSIWIRLNKKTYDAVIVMGSICVEQKRSMDDVLGRLVQLIANGEAEALLKKITDETPAADIPPGFTALPTKDALEKVS